MNEISVYSRLCYYDKLNPDRDEDVEKGDGECFCDNCFYGRTVLAEKIIEMNDFLSSLISKYDTETGGTSSPITNDEIKKAKQITLKP